MKNSILSVFTMLLLWSSVALHASDITPMGGDVTPPFPWSTAESCSFAMDDFYGFWNVKQNAENGSPLYVYVEPKVSESGQSVLSLSLLRWWGGSKIERAPVIATGQGRMSSDYSQITGVLQISEGYENSGYNYWIYISTRCDRSSGRRQSILELNPDKSNAVFKYIFEKVTGL